MLGIAKIRAREFCGCRPCGEDVGIGEVLGYVIDGFLMDNDHVAVGEAVFRSIGRRWTVPESRNERHSREGDKPGPAVCTSAPDRNADEQNQRIDGEQITCEQRSAKY